MDDTRAKILSDIINSFDQTYLEFLDAGGFTNSAIVKTGFFVAMEQIVRENTHPDTEIQAAVLKHIVQAQRDSLDDFLERVEFMFMEVGLRKMRQTWAMESFGGLTKIISE